MKKLLFSIMLLLLAPAFIMAAQETTTAHDTENELVTYIENKGKQAIADLNSNMHNLYKEPALPTSMLQLHFNATSVDLIHESNMSNLQRLQSSLYQRTDTDNGNILSPEQIEHLKEQAQGDIEAYSQIEAMLRQQIATYDSNISQLQSLVPSPHVCINTDNVKTLTTQQIEHLQELARRDIETYSQRITEVTTSYLTKAADTRTKADNLYNKARAQYDKTLSFTAEETDARLTTMQSALYLGRIAVQQTIIGSQQNTINLEAMKNAQERYVLSLKKFLELTTNQQSTSQQPSEKSKKTTKHQPSNRPSHPNKQPQAINHRSKNAHQVALTTNEQLTRQRVTMQTAPSIDKQQQSVTQQASSSTTLAHQDHVNQQQVADTQSQQHVIHHNQTPTHQAILPKNEQLISPQQLQLTTPQTSSSTHPTQQVNQYQSTLHQKITPQPATTQTTLTTTHAIGLAAILATTIYGIATGIPHKVITWIKAKIGKKTDSPSHAKQSTTLTPSAQTAPHIHPVAR